MLIEPVHFTVSAVLPILANSRLASEEEKEEENTGLDQTDRNGRTPGHQAVFCKLQVWLWSLRCGPQILVSAFSAWPIAPKILPPSLEVEIQGLSLVS